MSIALCVVGDGRGEYLEACAASADQFGFGPFDERVMVDDSGDSEYAAHLDGEYPDFKIIHHDRRLGLAQAVRSGWEATTTDCVFHLEEDFLFLAPVDLRAMALTLARRPHLSQLVLKRQPWSPEERAAGGIIEAHPDDYDEWVTFAEVVVAHRRIFSLNPCLIPRRVIDLGWPDGNEAEFTATLNAAPDNRFAFWGAASDPPLVLHIGEKRSPSWRL